MPPVCAQEVALRRVCDHHQCVATLWKWLRECTGSEGVKVRKGHRDIMNWRMERKSECRDSGRKGHGWGNG